MQKKVKDKIITIGFITIIAIVFLANMIVRDQKVSSTERRKLAQVPEVTVKNIMNGDTFKEFEEYVMDQFIARDTLRSIKSYVNINILKQKDTNKLFIKNNAIYKIEYPLNKKNVEKSVNKINEICDKYLQGTNVYYAIIPDKNYYLDGDDYLKIDYTELEQIMKDNIKNAQYINISGSLSLNDYYRTDTHWKQENLGAVVKTIENNMNLKDISNDKYQTATDNTYKDTADSTYVDMKDITYNVEELGDFYGVYYGQLGMKIQPDTLKILTNDILDNCKVYNLEERKESKIYDKNKWEKSSDKYDIFLSGATPIITIENPNAETQKELLLFRDSYGSSLAPLLVENYSKITLIDIRYISSKLLSNYIEFNDQDVLFLYSTLVLNQNILK